MKESYEIPALPPKADLETTRILKALAKASRSLAELNGRAASIPNQSILIDTLGLQEALASSAIENIVTTNDRLFRAEKDFDQLLKGPEKEVALYREALFLGYNDLLATGTIRNRSIVEMFRLIKGRTDGFRSTPGTALKHDRTGQIVYVPPQHPTRVLDHMRDLERFMNTAGDLDPLINMAVIHHQFESIHPFPDGNGRIGRILNVLYLTKEGLLDLPVLYMSRGINRRKAEYYSKLQEVRDQGAWEDWIEFVLEVVEETARLTLGLVNGVRDQMFHFKTVLRRDHSAIYSQDLINNLFRHPYTRIEYVMKDLGKSRPTARKYLEELLGNPELEIRKIVDGRDHYYVNSRLVDLLLAAADET